MKLTLVRIRENYSSSWFQQYTTFWKLKESRLMWSPSCVWTNISYISQWCTDQSNSIRKFFLIWHIRKTVVYLQVRARVSIDVWGNSRVALHPCCGDSRPQRPGPNFGEIVVYPFVNFFQSGRPPWTFRCWRLALIWRASLSVGITRGQWWRHFLLLGANKGSGFRGRCMCGSLCSSLCGSLDVFRRPGLRHNSRERVREVQARGVGPFQAHHSRVVGPGGHFLRVERSYPNAILRLRIAGLRYPLPPFPHPHSLVFDRGRALLLHRIRARWSAGRTIPGPQVLHPSFAHGGARTHLLLLLHHCIGLVTAPERSLRPRSPESAIATKTKQKPPRCWQSND